MPATNNLSPPLAQTTPAGEPLRQSLAPTVSVESASGRPESAPGFDLPLALTLILAVLIGFQPIPSDPDLWFHLASGERILAGDGVPRTDPFSFTRAGQPWTPHSWLFDAGVAAMWHEFGPRAAEAAFTLVYMLAFAVSFQILVSRGVDPMKALLVVAGLAIAAGNTRGLRPQVLSLLLANLLLLALVAHRRRPGAWMVAALALLFVLWAQVHAACVMGVALAGIWTLGRAIDGCRAALARRSAAHDFARSGSVGREVPLLTCGLVSAVLAVLITPHAITHYEYVRLTMNLAFLRDYVAEWQPPQLWPVALPDVYQYLLALAVAAAVIRRRLRRRSESAKSRTMPEKAPGGAQGIDLASLGVAAFTLAAGFTAARHIPLACVGCVPLLAELLRGNPPAPERNRACSPAASSRHQRWTRGDLRGVAVCWTIVLAVLLGFWRFPTTVERRYAAAEPVRGAAALKALDRPLRVFTTYDTGAYVSWSAPGRLRVFVDSRADVYGDELLRQAHAAAAGQGWKPLFAQWDVQAAVLGRGDRLARTLRDDPDWTLLADDEDSVTFLSASVEHTMAKTVP